MLILIIIIGYLLNIMLSFGVKIYDENLYRELNKYYYFRIFKKIPFGLIGLLLLGFINSKFNLKIKLNRKR